MFELTDEAYNYLKEKITKINKSNIKIDFNDYDDFKTTYFSIFPDGSMKDDKGIVTCNLLKESMDDCISHINVTNHSTRRKTFKEFEEVDN